MHATLLHPAKMLNWPLLFQEMKRWLIFCIWLSCTQLGATEAVALAYQNAESGYTLLGYSKTLNTIVTTTPEQNCIRIPTAEPPDYEAVF